MRLNLNLHPHPLQPQVRNPHSRQNRPMIRTPPLQIPHTSRKDLITDFRQI